MRLWPEPPTKPSLTFVNVGKPRLRPYKLFDTDGLYLLITPAGGRWWRQRYRWGGKEKLLSVGTYPEVALTTARERRDEIRKQIANGIDPGIVRVEQKGAMTAASPEVMTIR